MTRFLDGPATGQTMMLRRAVIFLRVTRKKFALAENVSRTEKFDALDAPDDTPAADEELFCYKNTGKEGGNVHIRFGGNQKRRSGFYAIAEYALYPDQPPDEVMRDNTRWREWCKQQALAHNIKHA